MFATNWDSNVIDRTLGALAQNYPHRKRDSRSLRFLPICGLLRFAQHAPQSRVPLIFASTTNGHAVVNALVSPPCSGRPLGRGKILVGRLGSLTRELDAGKGDSKCKQDCVVWLGTAAEIG
jgi:hypothetical protein